MKNKQQRYTLATSLVRPSLVRPVLVSAVLASAVLVSACGSQADDSAGLATLADEGESQNTSNQDGDNTASGDQPELSEADMDRALVEYEACMADFGVDSGIVSVEGGEELELDQVEEDDQADVDIEKLNEAYESCDPILDKAFGDFNLSPEEEAEMADQELQLQRCMTEKGFDISEDATLGPEVDFDALDKAIAECDKQLGLDASMSETDE